MTSHESGFLFLGTGTSSGVPQIGCRCAVCLSTDPKDNRLRCSGLIRAHGKQVLVDTTPDFRSQALRVGLDSLDAVFITHAHADHIFGLDDLRPLSLNRSEALPVFASAATAQELRKIFGYVFNSLERRPGLPWLRLEVVESGQPFEIAGLAMTAFAMQHGRGESFGLRCENFAYATDLKSIPPASMEVLKGVEVLALDMLRYEPHATHLCLEESLDIVAKLGTPETRFMHMTHVINHAELNAKLPDKVALAYDGEFLPF